MNVTKKSNAMFFPTDHQWLNYFLKLPDAYSKEMKQCSHVAVNIKDAENNYLIELVVPGYEKDSFSIQVKDELLTIKSELKNDREEVNESGKYSRVEYSIFNFEKTFTLPEDVEEERIEAEYKEGILYLNLPKKEKQPNSSTRQIEVR